MSRINKKLIFVPLLLIISHLNFAQEYSELKGKYASRELDSLMNNSFRPASNSKDFLIIKKENYIYLRELLFTVDANLKEVIFDDSIYREEFKLIIDSLNNEVSNLKQQINSIPKFKAESKGMSFYQFFSIISSVIIFFISIKLVSQIKYIRGIKEAFIEIENTFQSHKRKSIEKERKIKRQLIDSNLRLEDLENQLKLLNHSD